MLGVPSFDSYWADVMDSVRESDALTQVPTRRFAELTGAPIGKLTEFIHRIPMLGELN
jgi:hypothetical protein